MYKVLIVDDEIQSLKYIQSLIDWDSLELKLSLATTSSKEAVQFLCRNEVDFVLTDVMMDEYTGIDISEIIHKDHPSIKLLALSSYDDYQFVRQILLNGAFDYLLKHQLNADVINEKLKKMITLRKEEDEGKLLSNSEKGHLISFICKNDIEGFLHEFRKKTSKIETDRNLKISLLFSLLTQLNGYEHFKTVLIFYENYCLKHDVDYFSFMKDELEHICFHKFYSTNFPSQVWQTLNLIYKNYTMNLSLEDAASILNINATYLSRIFHKAVGSTFVEELNAFRVWNAKREIIEGNTFKEIAFSCGFKNYSYFLKVFKKVTGETPKNYLDKVKNWQ